jgi:hypothetical protein
MSGKALWKAAACAALILSAGCCSWCERHCSTCHPAVAPAGYQPACCCPPPCCCQPAPAPAPASYPPPAATGTWSAPQGNGCCR